MKIAKDHIEYFWNWFSKNCSFLYANPTDTDILYYLDSEINRLGPFDWEIGPTDNKFYLAISPNLNHQLLGETEKIISLSPTTCSNWLFLDSKPPKPYCELIKILNENNKIISINISEWKYILYEFEDKTYDIDIIIDSANANNEITKHSVEIILTNILGEKTFMQLIKNIKIIPKSESSQQKITNLFFLYKHISKLR